MDETRLIRWEDARPVFLAFVARCARRRHKAGLLMLAGGIGVALVGLLVLTTFGMALVFWARKELGLGLSRELALILGGIVGLLLLGLLFLTYTPARIEELSEFSSPGERSLLAEVSLRTGKQNLGQLLICWLYGGPALVAAGRARLRGATGLRGDAAEACAAVLYVLSQAGRRVPFAELARATRGMDIREAAARLRAIDGVLFLDSDPPGLSLTTPLREELTCLTLGL